jgi:hypothetical protein
MPTRIRSSSAGQCQLRAGSSEVPNVPHFVAAKDGEVIFQANGIGPTALIPAHHSPE